MASNIDIGFLDNAWSVCDNVRGKYRNWREYTNWQEVLREHDTARSVHADRQTAARLRQDRPDSKKITG